VGWIIFTLLIETGLERDIYSLLVTSASAV
jgi:hypothetical protein